VFCKPRGAATSLAGTVREIVLSTHFDAHGVPDMIVMTAAATGKPISVGYTPTTW
jgi:hypothetical protein